MKKKLLYSILIFLIILLILSLFFTNKTKETFENGNSSYISYPDKDFTGAGDIKCIQTIAKSEDEVKNLAKNDCEKTPDCKAYVIFLNGSIWMYCLKNINDTTQLKDFNYTENPQIKNVTTYIKQLSNTNTIQEFEGAYPSNPEMNTLYLSISADDKLTIYKNNVEVGEFNSNDLVKKFVMPNFSENDKLQIKYENTKGTGYIIGNWLLNNKKYQTKPNIFKVLAPTYQNAPPSYGQALGCYRDVNNQSVMDLLLGGPVSSAEQCATIANYYKNNRPEYKGIKAYGIQDNICRASFNLPSSEKLTDDKCKTNQNQYGGNTGQTYVYQIDGETRTIRAISPAQVFNILGKLNKRLFDLDYENAIPIKIETGGPYIETSIKMDAPIPYTLEWIAPKIELQDIRVPVCTNKSYTEFNPNACIDSSTSTSCSSTIRPGFVASDKACITKQNVLESFENMKKPSNLNNEGIENILRAFDKVNQLHENKMTNTNGWDCYYFEFFKIQMVKARINNDNEVEIAGSGDTCDSLSVINPPININKELNKLKAVIGHENSEQIRQIRIILDYIKTAENNIRNSNSDKKVYNWYTFEISPEALKLGLENFIAMRINDNNEIEVKSKGSTKVVNFTQQNAMYTSALNRLTKNVDDNTNMTIAVYQIIENAVRGNKKISWKCVDTGDDKKYLRINSSGNVECNAYPVGNNLNCYSFKDKCNTDAKILLNQTGLSCGQQHLDMYGSIGYDNPNHWCATGLTKLGGSTNTSFYINPFKKGVLRLWNMGHKLLETNKALSQGIDTTKYTSFEDMSKVNDFKLQFKLMLEQVNNLCQTDVNQLKECNMMSNADTFYSNLKELMENANAIIKL